MLKINFISDDNNKEITNAIFTCVGYERNLMYIHLNNDSIAKCKDIIANKSGTRTDEEIKAAESKKIKLEEDNRRLEEENKAVEDVYKKTLSEISSASNEHAANDYNAVRNVFRLVACADNKKFYRIAIITDMLYGKMYDSFSALHSCEEANFDKNGIRISDNEESSYGKTGHGAGTGYHQEDVLYLNSEHIYKENQCQI